MVTQNIEAEANPAGTVQSYVDAINKGDGEAMAACFAAPGFIFDGMAPHVWSGPSASREWFRDALAESILSKKCRAGAPSCQWIAKTH